MVTGFPAFPASRPGSEPPYMSSGRFGPLQCHRHTGVHCPGSCIGAPIRVQAPVHFLRQGPGVLCATTLRCPGYARGRKRRCSAPGCRKAFPMAVSITQSSAAITAYRFSSSASRRLRSMGSVVVNSNRLWALTRRVFEKLHSQVGESVITFFNRRLPLLRPGLCQGGLTPVVGQGHVGGAPG